jgi:methionine synthase II (cobalamin-independent)
MAQPPVTRQVLAREIVLAAARRPLNVGVGAIVLVAGFLLNALWLVPIAVVVYAGMIVATALDGERAERVGAATYAKRKQLRPAAAELGPYLSPRVTERVHAAVVEEQRLRKSLEDSPLVEVSAEVDRLMSALADLAKHADRLEADLAEEDEPAIRRRLERLREVSDDPAVGRVNAEAAAALEEQLAARGQVERHVARFDAQIQHIAATLGALHAQVLRMSVEEEAGAQARLASEIRALRNEVGATADALEEAFGDVE